jgi:bla regulator protein blaR1
MRIRTPRLLGVLALLAMPIVHGATPQDPQFEVASIKPNKSGDGRVMLGVQPGGRFTATNVTLRMMIRNAYQLQDFQITGGPSWIAEERFDIVAKAETSDTMGDPFRGEQNGQPSRGQLMIRALLAERFKLVVHNETKEMPIYGLVVARSDGKLGPQLKPSEVDCAAQMAAGRGRGRGMPPPPGPPPPAGTPMQCGIRIGPGNMAVGGSPMTQVANSLSMFAGRIVVDKTGLAGNYDFTLMWTPDQMPGGGQRPPGAPEPPPIDPNGPSLFTAVQEQLGLKLDSQRGPVAVLVIDRAERPTEN